MKNEGDTRSEPNPEIAALSQKRKPMSFAEGSSSSSVSFDINGEPKEFQMPQQRLHQEMLQLMRDKERVKDEYLQIKGAASMRAGLPPLDRPDNLGPYIQYLMSKSVNEIFNERRHERKDLRPKVHKHDHNCLRVVDYDTSRGAKAPQEPHANQLNELQNRIISNNFPPKGKACDTEPLPLEPPSALFSS